MMGAMTTQVGDAGPAVPQDTLAMRLVIARVHAGHFNAASAAETVGVSRQNWANWERGRPMRHADALLPRIAAELGVDEEWLRDGGPLAAPMVQPDGGLRVVHGEAAQPTGWQVHTARAWVPRLVAA